MNRGVGLELNDLGWVSGVAVDFDFSAFEASGHHAFVWVGDPSAKTLPVAGYAYGESESDAHQITNNGTAVGSSGPAGGPDAATVWTCVQEPAYVPRGTAASPAHAAGGTPLRGWSHLHQLPWPGAGETFTSANRSTR